MMENPITSGQGSLSGAFRPSMNILAIPPVIESKHTLNVRVSAPQAQINVNISSQVARNNMKKSNLWVPRMYGNCKWLSELLQNAANYGKKDDGKKEKKIICFVDGFPTGYNSLRNEHENEQNIKSYIIDVTNNSEARRSLSLPENAHSFVLVEGKVESNFRV